MKAIFIVSVLFNGELRAAPLEQAEQQQPAQSASSLEQIIMRDSNNYQAKARESLEALRALRRFAPENLESIERVGEYLSKRSPGSLFDENGGFHTNIRKIKLVNVCQAFNESALRDSFTYEVARQLSIHTGNILPLLRKWAKSGNPTLEHIFYESLRGRSVVPEEAIPIIDEFGQNFKNYPTTDLMVLILKSKVTSQRQTSLAKIELLLSEASTKKCLSSPAFLAIVAQSGPPAFRIIAAEFDREVNGSNSFSSAAAIMPKIAELDSVSEKQLLSRLKAHYDCRCADRPYLRNLTRTLAQASSPSDDTIQFLLTVVGEPLPNCFNSPYFRDGATEALLLLGRRDKKYLQMLVDIPNFEVGSRSTVFMIELRNSSDPEVQSMIKALDLRRNLNMRRPSVAVPPSRSNMPSREPTPEESRVLRKLIGAITKNEEREFFKIFEQLDKSAIDLKVNGRTLLGEACHIPLPGTLRA